MHRGPSLCTPGAPQLIPVHAEEQSALQSNPNLIPSLFCFKPSWLSLESALTPTRPANLLPRSPASSLTPQIPHRPGFRASRLFPHCPESRLAPLPRPGASFSPGTSSPPKPQALKAATTQPQARWCLLF